MMHDFMITRDHAMFMDLPVVFDLDAADARRAAARAGTTPTARGSASCRASAPTPTCAGSTSTRATCSTRSTPTPTARRSCATSAATPSMWRDVDGRLPAVVPAPLDVRPGHRARSTETPLDDVSHAFPRVDDRVVGLRHRYGWAAAPRAGDRRRARRRPASSSSTTSRPATRERYDLGPPAHPGEFVFVRDDRRRRRGRRLGDRAACTTTTTDRSDLVILDASDAAAEPVARVHLPAACRTGSTAAGSATPSCPDDAFGPDPGRRATRIRTERRTWVGSRRGLLQDVDAARRAEADDVGQADAWRPRSGGRRPRRAGGGRPPRCWRCRSPRSGGPSTAGRPTR